MLSHVSFPLEAFQALAENILDYLLDDQHSCETLKSASPDKIKLFLNNLSQDSFNKYKEIERYTDEILKNNAIPMEDVIIQLKKAGLLTDAVFFSLRKYCEHLNIAAHFNTRGKIHNLLGTFVYDPILKIRYKSEKLRKLGIILEDFESKGSKEEKISLSAAQGGAHLIEKEQLIHQIKLHMGSMLLYLDTCKDDGTMVNFRNILARINELTSMSDKESLLSKYGINSKNEKGETALLTASKKGDADFVKALLDHKANPARQGEKATALGYAVVMNKNPDCVKLLIDAGADVNEHNYQGDTPLSLAMFYEKKEFATLLLDAKANPNIPGYDGEYPIHTAIKKDQISLLEKLLRCHANVDCQDSWGQYPLMYAIRRNPKIVLTLIAADANVNLTNNRGENALDIALNETKPDKKIIDILFGKKIQINESAKLKLREYFLKIYEEEVSIKARDKAAAKLLDINQKETKSLPALQPFSAPLSTPADVRVEHKETVVELAIDFKSINDCINDFEEKNTKHIMNKLLDDFKNYIERNIPISFKHLLFLEFMISEFRSKMRNHIHSKFDLILVNSILSDLSKKLENHKTSANLKPTRREQDLVLQQQILLEDRDVKNIFEGVLFEIRNILNKDNKWQKITIVGAEVDAEYLNWVYPFLQNFKMLLVLSGIKNVVIMTPKEAPLGSNYYKFMEEIVSSDKVLVFGTEGLLKALTLGKTSISNQLALIEKKREHDLSLGKPISIIPILISGDLDSSFPEIYHYNCVNWIGATSYLECLKSIIFLLINSNPEDARYNTIWTSFLEAIPADKKAILASGVTPTHGHKEEKREAAPMSQAPPSYQEAVLVGDSKETVAENHVHCFGVFSGSASHSAPSEVPSKEEKREAAPLPPSYQEAVLVGDSKEAVTENPVHCFGVFSGSAAHSVPAEVPSVVAKPPGGLAFS